MNIKCQNCKKQLTLKNAREGVFTKGRGRCIACASFLYRSNASLRARKRRYYLKHKKHIKKKAAKRYNENKSLFQKQSRKRYLENRDKYLAQRKSLSGKHVTLRIVLRKEKIPKTDMIWHLNFYTELVKDGECHYCLGPLNQTGTSLDAKDNSAGHAGYNVVPCCRSCNQKKMHDVTYDEMFKFLSPVLRLIRKNRIGEQNGFSLHKQQR